MGEDGIIKSVGLNTSMNSEISHDPFEEGHADSLVCTYERKSSKRLSPDLLPNGDENSTSSMTWLEDEQKSEHKIIKEIDPSKANPIGSFFGIFSQSIKN